MSKLTRTLILGAALAAMNLAGMAVAQAQPPDGVEQFRRGERASQEQSTTAEAVEEFRRGERAAQEQTAADAAVQRQLARERHSIPSGTPAQVPAPAPAEPNGQPGWLLASLGALTIVLGLVGGLAVLAARRAAAGRGLGTRPDHGHKHATLDGAAAPTRQPHHPAGDGSFAYLASGPRQRIRRPVRARLLERITSPLTVGGDLGKGRSAQR